MTKPFLISTLLLVATAVAPAQDSVQLGQALTNAEAYQKQGKFPEALQQYDIALAAAGRVYPIGHRNIGVVLGQRGALYRLIGEPAKAKVDLLAALQIYEQGQDARLKAEGVNNLAAACVELGEYSEARALHERGFQLMSTAYGAESPQAAVSLGNLAGVYRQQGRDADAEAMFKRQIGVLSKAGPKYTREYANSLMNLANVYQSQLDYPHAEPLYQNSIALLESIYGAKHFEVARVRNNLATLYSGVGQFDRAEAELRRVIEVLDLTLGKNGVDAARSKNNLASILVHKKDYAGAERLYREVIATREEKLGANHPDVALTLSTLGITLLETGRFDDARRALERSLEIRKQAYGAESGPAAISLGFLGEAALREKKLDDAERLLLQANEIRTAILPAGHPELMTSRIWLGILRAAQNRDVDALREFDLGRKASYEFIQRQLPALSDSEQLAYLRNGDDANLHVGLSLILKHPNDPVFAERTAEWILNAKGVAGEVAARRALLARDTGDKTTAAIMEALAYARKKLAALWYDEKTKSAEIKRQSEDLSRQEQEITRKLVAQGGRAAPPWLELSALRERLKPGEVYIDLFRVRPFDRAVTLYDPNQPGRYVAWITPQSGAVKAVDLGPAEAVDAAVKQVRQALTDAPPLLKSDGEMKADVQIRAELTRLADLVLKPLLAAAGDCKRIHLSPDSSLWLVPWAALPVNDKELLLEKVALQYAASGRDLIAKRPTAQATKPVLFADPDYNLSPTTATTGKSRFGNVERLPASEWEAAVIQPKLQALANDEPELFSGKNAIEAKFKKLTRPRYLLVSTHGFFQETSGATAAGNPLLNCGLLLAGCNKPPALLTADSEDGVLTGLEIVGADLRGTELVVLSACNTGVGTVRDGEGVAGLRQAFQLAGASAVVSTLWEVPDRDSAIIMSDFFTELAAGQDKAEALRAAQLKRLNTRREKYGAAHPIYWAAWTLTGD